ncbi:MAG: RNA polymerase sigma-70 factor [Hymenobacter sp.]
MKVRTLTVAAGPHHAAWDDTTLARALAEDDEQAFAEIYERYWSPLHAHACRKLSCAHEAEEVVQDLFVALWHKRHTAVIQQLNAYLFSALKYQIIDCIRGQLVRKAYATDATPRLVTPDCGTEETVAAADLTAALAASVSSLPGHAREVFRLSRLEYRSVPEIAAYLQVSPKTVEYHLARSLKLLRTYLKEFLVSTVLLLQLGDPGCIF